jgi:hypothetical protein
VLARNAEKLRSLRAVIRREECGAEVVDATWASGVLCRAAMLRGR